MHQSQHDTKLHWSVSAPSSHRATGAHTRCLGHVARRCVVRPPLSGAQDVSPQRAQRRTVRFPVLERLVSGDIASDSACGLAILGPRWTDVMATAPCTPTKNHCRTDQLRHRRKHQSFTLNALVACHTSTACFNISFVTTHRFLRPIFHALPHSIVRSQRTASQCQLRGQPRGNRMRASMVRLPRHLLMFLPSPCWCHRRFRLG